ncbi:MAG TPA: tetratricopeptide repeat protein, partial [Gemmataceae bacterium]|nr:tetratricopeptide repeat protein [Gemmataceae bacterium]
MKTNTITAGNDGSSASSPSLVPPQPAEGRLQQLCQGLFWVLGRDTPQESASPASPNGQLQAEAGRILRPHLEAGLRELTEVLRDDLLVRIAYVQQLERLTQQQHDASSLSRLLQGPSRPSDAASVSELAASPTNLSSDQEAPLSSAGPPEFRFDWQSATLQTEQPQPSETAPPTPDSATTADVATLKAVPSLPSSPPASLEADLRQAVELWRQGDEDHALALCSRILQHNPAAAPAYLLRGQMHEQRRQLEHALADFTSAIALCPHHPKAYLRRGLIHLRQKAWQEAIADANAV